VGGDEDRVEAVFIWFVRRAPFLLLSRLAQDGDRVRAQCHGSVGDKQEDGLDEQIKIMSSLWKRESQKDSPTFYFDRPQPLSHSSQIEENIPGLLSPPA
jgi:hypothetical protein